MKTDGEALRDAALSQVQDNAEPWSDRAWALANKHVTRYLVPPQFTGEDLYSQIVCIIGPPHHSNAAGAFIMRCVRGKLIESTGVWVKMRNPRSHARKTPLYRWVPRLPTQVEMLI
jgi:hypothetical protein